VSALSFNCCHFIRTFATAGEPFVADMAFPVAAEPFPGTNLALNVASGLQSSGLTLPSSLNSRGWKMWPPQAIRGPPAEIDQ
jgi:hypothetical protein